MANKKYEETDIQAIADAIREKTGSEDSFKVSEMSSGVTEVYEAGKKAEWSEFWDAFQQNGKRTDYNRAFSYYGWTNSNFKPKYPMKPNNVQQMFYRCTRLSGEVDEVLNIDFSNCTDFTQTFQDFQKITRLGIIDMRKATVATNIFAYCSELVTIDKIIMSETSPSPSFVGSSKITNVLFEGFITKNISFSACPLTVKSMKSIISCLKDYSGTDEEFTYKVTFSSACITALDAEGNTSPNGNSWRDYISDLGWNLG